MSSSEEDQEFCSPNGQNDKTGRADRCSKFSNKFTMSKRVQKNVCYKLQIISVCIILSSRFCDEATVICRKFGRILRQFIFHRNLMRKTISKNIFVVNCYPKPQSCCVSKLAGQVQKTDERIFIAIRR